MIAVRPDQIMVWWAFRMSASFSSRVEMPAAGPKLHWPGSQH
jgi:hypothetical protein